MKFDPCYVDISYSIEIHNFLIYVNKFLKNLKLERKSNWTKHVPNPTKTNMF